MICGHVSLIRAYERSWLADGILVDALCLDSQKRSAESIGDTYKKYGPGRVCTAYTLSHGNNPQAYFVVDRSDKGVNLSDLINSIKVIVPRNSSVPFPSSIQD